MRKRATSVLIVLAAAIAATGTLAEIEGTALAAGGPGAGRGSGPVASGSLLAWGKNVNGELGDGTRKTRSVPVTVTLPTGTKVTAVTAGAHHTLALTAAGSVLAWGSNTDGELGDGATQTSLVPVSVNLAPGIRITAVQAGLPRQHGSDRCGSGADLGRQRLRRARRRHQD